MTFPSVNHRRFVPQRVSSVRQADSLVESSQRTEISHWPVFLDRLSAVGRTKPADRASGMGFALPFGAVGALGAATMVCVGLRLHV